MGRTPLAETARREIGPPSTETSQSPVRAASRRAPYFMQEHYDRATWGTASPQVAMSKHLRPLYGGASERALKSRCRVGLASLQYVSTLGRRPMLRYTLT
eukprot:1000321-Alexandrium_andersonii.AAC.1